MISIKFIVDSFLCWEWFLTKLFGLLFDSMTEPSYIIKSLEKEFLCILISMTIVGAILKLIRS